MTYATFQISALVGRDFHISFQRVFYECLQLVFFRWDISVICPVLKLAVTVFTSLPFQILWPNWL